VSHPFFHHEIGDASIKDLIKKIKADPKDSLRRILNNLSESICLKIEENILKELNIEKGLIENKKTL
jgi:hypothetical protein